MYKIALGLLAAGLAFNVGQIRNNAADNTSYIYGQNLIYNGDFKLGPDSYVFPSNAPTEGVVAGYGKLGADIAPVAIKDPNNSENTILSFSGGGFSSFFKLLTIESGSTYDISFEYKVVGSTDNIGFAFWNVTAANRLPEINIMDSNQNKDCTFTTLENDWKRVSVSRLFGAGNTFDSMHMWVNASGSNIIYVDNIKMIKQGTTENIFSGGDFEGFLNYGQSTFTETPNGDGLFGTNANLGNGYVKISGATGNYGSTVKGLSKDLYTLEIKYDGTLGESDSLKFNVSSDTETLKTIDITSANFTITFTKYATATKVSIDYTGSGSVNIKCFSLKETYENVFDPTKTYYEGDNLVVNGDFEAFDVGTKFSENQLEGAWGSVSLDNPGRIVADGSNKVAAIGKIDANDTKSYSSMFLMTPDDISVGDLIRLKYDYKLTISDEPTTYSDLNSCFVGGANQSYYKIDLSKLVYDNTYSATSGVEDTPYAIKYTKLENGYVRVTLDIQVSVDKVQWNSVRWLFTPHAVGDTLYVDNVEIRQLSETPWTKPVTAVKIAEGDIELKVGAEKNLTCTVTPTDADDKTITWSSSKTSVATVDQNGKVKAIAAGTAEITATSSNGVSDSIVVTVLADSDPITPVTPDSDKTTGPNVGLIVGLCVGGVVIVAGAIVAYVLISKKHKKGTK